MPNIKAETTVSYPVSYVYGFCENIETLPQVVSRVKSCTVTKDSAGAEVVHLDLQLSESEAAIAKKFVGDVSEGITARVTRETNKSVTIERVSGPFESFTVRMTFNEAAGGQKTQIVADIDFDAGGWGVANKAIMAAFNSKADSLLSNVDEKIKEAIEKGELKLPPPGDGGPKPDGPL